MKALFDIGNTRIKWAWLDLNGDLAGDQVGLQDAGRAAYGQSTLTDIATANWLDWPRPEQVWVSSVAADEHWQQLSDWCVEHWQQTPLRVISAAEGFGIRNAYAQPEELGSDRWAALIGAHHLLSADICIVDCGTAITVDFLDAAGTHLGGYIIPGLQLMQQSLARRTEAIELSHWPAGVDAIIRTGPGKSTSECSEYGIIMAAAGLVERSCKKMETITGKTFQRLFTGGNAETLAAALDSDVQIEPHLVLRGLAHIAAENDLLKSSK